MPHYFKSGNGAVHVRCHIIGGEYTLCGFSFDAPDTTDAHELLGDGDLKACDGPATCAMCKREYDKTRRNLRGVVFKPPSLAPCFGVSPKTGKRVGARHRWGSGGMCIYCHRFKDDLLRIEIDETH